MEFRGGIELGIGVFLTFWKNGYTEYLVSLAAE